jgi:hypothetical protein
MFLRISPLGGGMILRNHTESLRGRSGLHVNAQRLRSASSDAEREKVAVTTWYEAQKQVATAMREDLKRLSGGLQ